MTSTVLADVVRATAVDVLSARGLDVAALPGTVTIERPRNPEHGDYATNVALQTASRLGVGAHDLAGWLAEALREQDMLSSVEIAGPGFLNLRLSSRATWRIVLAVGEYDISADISADVAAAVPAAQWAELVDAVGVDAARYALVRSGVDSTPEIDIDLFVRQDDENPAYYLQYTYAGLCSLLRGAVELGIDTNRDPSTVELSLAGGESEGELVRTLGEFPVVVGAAAELREPCRVARYLERLATAYHRFHDSHRVLPQGDEAPTEVTAARLALCAASRQVLGNGLALLGVSAPERM